MKDCPIDAAIVGIVDTVTGGGERMHLARVIGTVVTTRKDENLARS